MRIKGFLKSSFLDWDGKVCSVVFLPGCNFRCVFCHNWMLVEKAEEIPDVPEDYVFSFLSENLDFIDGVCITGGEPCLHAHEVIAFAKKVKELGLGVKIDTNGSMPQALEKFVDEGIVDYVAMDVKAPIESEKYARVCGVNVELVKIKESIEIVKGLKDYEFRTTYIPALHSASDIASIVTSLGMPKRYVLQRFLPSNAFAESLRKSKEASLQELEAIASMIKGKAMEIVVR